ncbi:MAG TPA: tetratricopeptide repeat protein [Vicinamibacterales bacterium]
MFSRPRRSRLGLVGILTLSAASLLLAQRGTAPARPPLEDVARRPVTLRENIGRAHEAVTTQVPRAQAFYDQGLAYLHSYVWLEAARSFNEALRADANLAMAQLGLSYALGELGLREPSRSAAAAAQRLGANATDRERVRIDVRVRQVAATAQPSDAALQAAYAKAKDQALEKYPKDVELLLLIGQAQDPPLASHGLDHDSSSLPFYRRALEQAPDYFAVHHYLAHAYENQNRLDLALPHAERFARDASAIPHAHHMYGHVLRRVSRIDEAIREFVKADELETSYFKRDGVPPEYDWHYRHNLNLLGMAYQYVGQLKAAGEVLRRSFELESAVPPADDVNRKEWPALLLAQGRPADALAAARTLTGAATPLVRAVGYLLASRALQAQKQLPAAAEQGNLALQQMRAAGPVGGTLVPEFQLTQGEYLLRAGDAMKGRAMVLDAVQKLRAQAGPDAWAQTLFSLEAAARTAREIGDWELAAKLADAMRGHDGGYAGTEYALATIAEHNGDRTTAAGLFKNAVLRWANADPDLPALSDAKRRAAAP